MSHVDPRLDLAGLTPRAEAARVAEALDERRVIVRAHSERCITPADQAAVYNLVNLASRLFAHVELDVDGDHPWLPPLRSGGSLGGRLGEAHATMSLAPAADPHEDLVLAWGRAGDIAGDASGWTYAFGDRYDPLPATPPASAGLAAIAGSSFMIAQAFGIALAPLGMPFNRVGWTVSNLLDLRNAPAPAAPDLDEVRVGRGALLGTGSVGSSLVYASLLAGVRGGPLAGVDPDGFSPRNRLRYPVLTAPTEGPKAAWLAELCQGSGLDLAPHVGDIRGWLAASADVPVEDLVLCSVDTVDGRRDATDVLARRMINCGVNGLALHVSSHGFGDDEGCAFCQYVDVEPALSGAALLGQAIGLPPERVIAVQEADGRLTQVEVEIIVAANVLRGPAPEVGDRLEDLRRRAYAQAAIPAGNDAAGVLVSAPQVSALAGLFMLVEAIKESTVALRPFASRRRVDLDTSGRPPGFTLPHRRDASKRCLCWSGFRRRAWRELHAA